MSLNFPKATWELFCFKLYHPGVADVNWVLSDCSV